MKYQENLEQKSGIFSEKISNKNSANFLGIFSAIVFAKNFVNLPDLSRILIISNDVDITDDQIDELESIFGLIVFCVSTSQQSQYRSSCIEAARFELHKHLKTVFYED